MVLIREFIALLPLDVIIKVKTFRNFFALVIFARHH